uniref:Uncharacterized protein n=1 Tax=Candidatus Methanogaster sp. ANME-2c ERB4 TaxID=2759911 RepID=A0A7G9YPE0_9EURY|nr:hypothetical protein HMIKAMFF_00034 [Methanosarcinales archaeon ANME-2c ERB4]
MKSFQDPVYADGTWANVIGASPVTALPSMLILHTTTT